MFLIHFNLSICVYGCVFVLCSSFFYVLSFFLRQSAVVFVVLMRCYVPPCLRFSPPPHSPWAMPAIRRHIFEHVRGQVGSHWSHTVRFTGHGHDVFFKIVKSKSQFSAQLIQSFFWERNPSPVEKQSWLQEQYWNLTKFTLKEQLCWLYSLR